MWSHLITNCSRVRTVIFPVEKVVVYVMLSYYVMAVSPLYKCMLAVRLCSQLYGD